MNINVFTVVNWHIVRSSVNWWTHNTGSLEPKRRVWVIAVKPPLRYADRYSWLLADQGRYQLISRLFIHSTRCTQLSDLSQLGDQQCTCVGRPFDHRHQGTIALELVCARPANVGEDYWTRDRCIYGSSLFTHQACVHCGLDVLIISDSWAELLALLDSKGSPAYG
jgi:hypothetical protein